MIAEIDKLNAADPQNPITHIINAAGVTGIKSVSVKQSTINDFMIFVGRPNVDWCEDHKVETIRTNVIGCLNVAGD